MFGGARLDLRDDLLQDTLSLDPSMKRPLSRVSGRDYSVVAGDPHRLRHRSECVLPILACAKVIVEPLVSFEPEAEGGSCASCWGRCD